MIEEAKHPSSKFLRHHAVVRLDVSTPVGGAQRTFGDLVPARTLTRPAKPVRGAETPISEQLNLNLPERRVTSSLLRAPTAVQHQSVPATTLGFS